MTAAVIGHRRRMVRLVSVETAAKRSVFSSRQKVSRDGALQTDAGSSFHVLAAATENRLCEPWPTWNHRRWHGRICLADMNETTRVRHREHQIVSRDEASAGQVMVDGVESRR